MKAALAATLPAPRRWFQSVQRRTNCSHWAGALADAGSRPASALLSGTLPAMVIRMATM